MFFGEKKRHLKMEAHSSASGLVFSRLTFQSLPAVFRGVSLMLCTLLYMPQTHHP